MSTETLSTENFTLSGVEQKSSVEFPQHQVLSIAQKFPGNKAVVYRNKILTFADLVQRATLVAHKLSGEGVRQGDRCGVCVSPGLDAPVAALAIHLLGATYFPLDPGAPKDRLEFMLADAKPKVILLEHKNILAESFTHQITTIDLHKLDWEEEGIEPLSFIQPDGEDIANIFYTSGTTGQPKGVLATYNNYRHYVNSAVNRFGMGLGTAMPAVAKFTFSISLFELIAPLAAGGTVELLPRDLVLEPAEMVNVLKRSSMIHVGPSLWHRILSQIESSNEDYSNFAHLQHVSTGGDMVPPEVLRRLIAIFSNAEVYVIYGCTEVSCMGTAYFVPREQEIEKTYVGTPFTDMRVAIVKYDGDRFVGPGDKGEICFAGGGIVKTYIGRDQDFQKKLITFGNQAYYRTGDVGRINDEGQVEMLGRDDFQVKVSGVRIELSEIDQQLKKALSEVQCITMCWANEDGENKIYAYVTKELTPEEIQKVREHLNNTLLEQMQPKNFIYVEALPLNTNLKVDRKALPKPNKQNILREAEFGIPETPTQEALLGIWHGLLKNEDIGIDDDFFYSGGSSLNGVDLMAQIEQKMGIDLPLNTLMSNRTVRSLAGVIDGGDDADQRIIPIKKTDSAKSIFFIHDGNGDVMPYYSLSQQLDCPHAVFGVVPSSRGKAEITFLTFDGIVSDLATQIENAQPAGPISVGGLCIGGYLAYCVAAELQKRSLEVENVILFDSHYIDATPRRDLGDNSREARFKKLFTNVRDERFSVSSLVNLFKGVVGKVFGYSHYRISQFIKMRVRSIKLKTLALANRYPALYAYSLPFPDVDSVLRVAEEQVKTRPKFNGTVVMYQATVRLHTLDHLEINDTPYCEIFEEEDLGWSKYHGNNMILQRINAGHSTLLTPPYSDEVAEHLARDVF